MQLKHLITIGMITAISIPAQAQPRSCDISKTKDFELSGDGHAAEWRTTDSIPLQLLKGPVHYKAYVKLLYSEKGLYLLYVNEDRKLTATYDRDFMPLFKEDVVEVFLWPDESIPVYLEYELSPLNHELVIQIINKDGKTSATQPWPYEGSKKPRHSTEITKNDKGEVQQWSAEVFIPYSLLYPLASYPPEAKTSWRANFYRIDYDGAEPSWWGWSPVENNFHDFRLFGTIRFK